MESYTLCTHQKTEAKKQHCAFGVEKKREKEEKIQWLNVKIAGMEEKHRIVLLTYLAYESQGKKLPRSLTLKLRTQLNLEQSSIRVYKKEALEALNINS